MAFEAMTHKEDQMVRLGAKLVEEKKVEKTATEAKMDNEGETSTLANVARNVASAIEWALSECLIFVTGSRAADGTIKYTLNTQYGLNDIAPDMLVQLVAAYTAGTLGFKELRDRYRLAGLATMTDAEVQNEATKRQAEQDARDAKKAEDAAKLGQKYPAPVAKPAAAKSKPAPAKK
jgi:hypothetical protein